MPGITYREATLDDAELASELMAAAYPAMTHDPMVIRFRWSNSREGYTAGRFIADIDGRPAAFVSFYHGPWEKLPGRHCEVEVWLDRSQLSVERLIELWSWIADKALAEGSYLLLAYCGEDEPEMLESLAKLGYERKRLEKVWELDLRAHGERLEQEAADARAEMDRSGIRLLTVASWADPDKERKLFELNESTVQDVPHSLPILPEQFADFLKRLRAPDRRADRWWIALDGDRPVAMSFLKFPPVRGTIWTGYTCTDPEYRGRGIARATKLQSLAQAVELHAPLVRTDNDGENAPMLHINERLGYVRQPGWVEHHKRVDIKGA